jgi:hypothetical protein
LSSKFTEILQNVDKIYISSYKLQTEINYYSAILRLIKIKINNFSFN